MSNNPPDGGRMGTGRNDPPETGAVAGTRRELAVHGWP